MSSNPSIRLLIAEDEQNLGMVLYKEMSRLGHQVTLVHDAEAAIRTARESEFDVALLDIMMPGRSGLEVLQWIRSQSAALSRVPVVMLTSSRHSVDVNRAYDLRANGYLTKPETAHQLQEMLMDFKKYWLRWNEQPEVGVEEEQPRC